MNTNGPLPDMVDGLTWVHPIEVMSVIATLFDITEERQGMYYSTGHVVREIV